MLTCRPTVPHAVYLNHMCVYGASFEQQQNIYARLVGLNADSLVVLNDILYHSFFV